MNDRAQNDNNNWVAYMLYFRMALILLFFSPISYAGDVEILAVDEPPSSYIDSTGEVSGFSIDIVREIQKRVGDNSPIKVVPEARALITAAVKPNVLLLAFSRTPEREEDFHWITLLLRKPWVLYSHSSNRIKLNKLEEAASVSHIGVVIGDVREHFLSHQGFNNLSNTISHKQNIKMLQLNRIDLLFYEPLGMAYLSNELKIPLSEFNPVYRSKSTDVYLMMSKNNTNKSLVDKWRQASKAIKEDGTFESISHQWSIKINQETGLNYGYRDGALDLLE